MWIRNVSQSQQSNLILLNFPVEFLDAWCKEVRTGWSLLILPVLSVISTPQLLLYLVQHRNNYSAHLFGIPCAQDSANIVDIVRPDKEPCTVEMRSEEIEWEGAISILITLRDSIERDAPLSPLSSRMNDYSSQIPT